MDPTPRRASRKRIILMLFFGGLVLAVGGCALFLDNASFNGHTTDAREMLTGIGAITFVAGVLAVLAGALWGLARWIDRKRPSTPKA